jgi:hypothetical protein
MATTRLVTHCFYTRVHYFAEQGGSNQEPRGDQAGQRDPAIAPHRFLLHGLAHKSALKFLAELFD